MKPEEYPRIEILKKSKKGVITVNEQEMITLRVSQSSQGIITQQNVRVAGVCDFPDEMSGKAIWLSNGFNWTIGEHDGYVILVPTVK